MNNFRSSALVSPLAVLFAVAHPMPGASFQIGSVQLESLTTSATVITWTTSVPTISRAVLMSSQKAPMRTSAAPPSPVAVNRAEFVKLIPGSTYYVYIGATDSDGAYADTFASPLQFTTPPVDAAAALDYRIDITGPSHVFAGSDLYLELRPIQLAGSGTNLYFSSLAVTPTLDIELIYREYHGDARPPFYLWGGTNFAGVYSPPRLKIHTTASTPPGEYTVRVDTTAGSVTRTAAWTIYVERAAEPLSPPASKDPPPIPNLENWVNRLTYLGHKWCNTTEIMNFGWEGQVWYYDGGRVYQQMAQYFQDPQWEACAENILKQYRDFILSKNGGVVGWRLFSHGLAMRYWRTGDDASRSALLAAAQSSAFAASGGGVSDGLIRETAYILSSYVFAERLGAPRNTNLSTTVNYALGHLDMLVSGTATLHQTFFDGLMSEALIDYYTLTGDPRVPPAIKALLDWLWDNAADSTTGALNYHPTGLHRNYITEMNLLVAPAYAWYWSVSGDSTYLRRGDILFAHALDADISYSGKIFSQNFRWSFDYIRWRSGRNGSTVLAASQNDPPVVEAGADIRVNWPTTQVVLYGSGSDSNGNPLNYTWQQISGPAAAQIASPNDPTTTVTFTQEPIADVTYVFRLTASDALATAWDEVQVTLRPAQAWLAPDWKYRKAIVIGPNEVPVDLTRFPLLVKLSDPDLRSVRYGGKVADDTGSDVLFTSFDNVTPLSFEIEDYDPALGSLIAWVRADLRSQGTTVCLYFGNSLAQPRQPTSPVWDSNYRAVWHFNDTTPKTAHDSAVYRNDGTGSAVTAAPGWIGPGKDFPKGTFANISVPYSTSLDLGNDLTVEAWIRIEDTNNGGVILEQGAARPLAFQVNYGWATRLLAGVIPGWQIIAASANDVIKTSTWQHVVFTRWTGSSPGQALYIDGKSMPLARAGTTQFTPLEGATVIGTWPGVVTQSFVGTMDEVRMSSVARSPVWIATEYLNQSSPEGFYTVGPTETEGPDYRGVPSPPPASPSPGNGATGVSVTPTVTWSSSTGATSYDVYFGTVPTPPLATSITGTSYAPGTLTAGTTYFWRVVAKNPAGSTSSPLWSFTTASPPSPAPAMPSPTIAATGIALAPTLSWSASTGATSYDVYFGTGATPPLAATVAVTSYGPGTLPAGTKFFWRVVAKNTIGSASSGVWSFTTGAPPSPEPATTSPANAATEIQLAPTLIWSASAGATFYDVYFGTVATPPLVAAVTQTSYAPGKLKARTTFFWRLVAKNSFGATSSPVFSFTTGSPPTVAPGRIAIPANTTYTAGTVSYLAQDSIVADSGMTISGAADITFQAAGSIHLGPEFRATAGTAATTFLANIDPTIH